MVVAILEVICSVRSSLNKLSWGGMRGKHFVNQSGSQQDNKSVCWYRAMCPSPLPPIIPRDDEQGSHKRTDDAQVIGRVPITSAPSETRATLAFVKRDRQGRHSVG